MSPQGVPDRQAYWGRSVLRAPLPCHPVPNFYSWDTHPASGIPKEHVGYLLAALTGGEEIQESELE